jgi:hypothetical protein
MWDVGAATPGRLSVLSSFAASLDVIAQRAAADH